MILDLVFPRLCLCCKEAGVQKWFCSTCWDLLAWPDPAHRCRHCFCSSERVLCKDCASQALLCFARVFLFDHSPPASILRRNLESLEKAIGSMAFVFWDKLNLGPFDALSALPDEKGKRSVFRMAKQLASFLKVPYKCALKRTYEGFLKPTLELSKPDLFVDQRLILFDVGSSKAWLQKACAALSDAFPKKVLIFSLFDAMCEFSTE